METLSDILSPNNLRIVLAQTVIVAIGAIGMTLIIISGGIDLSVGSTIALTGVITALGINAGCRRRLALAAGILVGGFVGVVNGLVITRLRVVPFIATLGMLGVARGIANGIAGQQTVNMPEHGLNELLVTFPNPRGCWLRREFGSRSCWRWSRRSFCDKQFLDGAFLPWARTKPRRAPVASPRIA